MIKITAITQSLSDYDSEAIIVIFSHNHWLSRNNLAYSLGMGQYIDKSNRLVRWGLIAANVMSMVRHHVSVHRQEQQPGYVGPCIC